MRQFRKDSCREVLTKWQGDLSLWAHQEDDFIETQMMRLIRGAGLGASSQPMCFYRCGEIRPLLQFSRKEIESYGQEFSIEFIEDPSNQNNAYLRNWIRNQWLPQLEQKLPGSLHSLSRSLVLLQDSHEISVPAEIWTENMQEIAISRPIYEQLSQNQRRQVIIEALKSRGILNFSHSQILEVMKQLDKSEKEHRFKVASLTWTASNDLILFTAKV